MPKKENSITYVILAGFAYRMLIYAISAYIDANYQVKFTDVDYSIFTGASNYIYQHQSPYMQPTYRYTPLLAYILLPNVWWPSFGKFVFILVDMLVAWVIYKILDKEGRDFRDIKLMMYFWLLMPINTCASVRGNADALISLLVMCAIYLLYVRKYMLAGIVFGLSIHFKFFPIIYSLTMVLFIRPHSPPLKNPKLSQLFFALFSKDRIIFILATGLTMVALTGFFYMLYGYQFIYETLLYHIIRVDNRHNISPYFYFMYLFYGTPYTNIASLLVFVPQSISTVIGLVASKDLPFAMFVQTVIFVVFNKVCTMQYYVWYISLGCLVLNRSTLSDKPKRILCLVSLYFLVNGLWLYYAYLLEFQSWNTFMMVFLYGIGVFWMHVVVLAVIVRYHDYRDIFMEMKTITDK